METSHLHEEIWGDECDYLTAKMLQNLRKGHLKKRERENVELGAKRVGPSQKSVTQPLCAFVASAY